MPTLRLQLGLLLLPLALHVQGQLSDLRRCADPMCQKVIAEARTTVKYPSGYRGVLSFPNNAVAKIYSKEAGSNLDWWGVEINGKRGYAPRKFLREDRVLVPDNLLQHIVPVDSSSPPSTNDKNELPLDAKIVNKIDEVRTTENLTADDNEETDGGEEFHDDGEDEEDGLDGFQLYNAGTNSPPDAEQGQKIAEATEALPSVAEVKAKSEEHPSVTESTSDSSSRDGGPDISPSNVDFEILDGTTIFMNPGDTTQPTPTYLPDFETPPPMRASVPTAAPATTATTATPPLAPSAETLALSSGAGGDISTTPELQIVPSGLPHSSRASREAPNAATPASVLAESTAAYVTQTGSSVMNLVDKSSSDTGHPEMVALSGTGHSEAIGVDDQGAGSASKEEMSDDDDKEKPDENNLDQLNASDLKLSSTSSISEGNSAGVDSAFAPKESKPSSAEYNGPSVKENFEKFSPILELNSASDVKLNPDHIIEEVLHDGDNNVHQSVDGGTTDSDSVALQSDDITKDAADATQESGDSSSDVQAEGGLFDGWLSGWSSAEDNSDADVEASKEPSPTESASHSQPGEHESSDVTHSGDGVVDDAPNSVGEMSFTATADQVTESEYGLSFDTTTEQMATTASEVAAGADSSGALDSSEGTLQNTDPSGEALVDGDGTISPAEPDSAGDSSDLHDPESLTGHLLKTVEPIILLMTGSSELGESLSLALEHDLSSPVAASGALVAVVILALTILLLYVASGLINKCSREGPLLKALNVLEHEQHTAEQLIADLQHKLSSNHDQAESLARTADTQEVARVMGQLQQVQEENASLAERVQDLEQQLEESTSSGLEMDNMLQELLHSQKDTASFQEAIDNLQLMLDSQREKVESLTADLSIKTTLNEELRGESASAKERIKKLEYQLDQVTQSLEEVNSAKAQVVAQLAAEQARLQQVTEERDTLARSSSDSSTALAALTEQHNGMQSRAQQLRSTLKTKEAELQVTKECLKQLKVFNDGKASKEKLAQLLDSVKARSELACAEEERRTLEAELQQRAEQVAQLERRLQQVQQEAEQCRSDKASADQEKQEALSKLSVLTDYFHEKEAQLTKELESESGLRLDAEGSAESVTSRIRDYDMQLLAYKTQVNTLKKELEDQEVSFKTQLAAQEQKAHESWVSARAAERKYEESKQETAQMRSRLLLMSKDNSEQQQHAIIKPTPQHAETSNGSVSSPRPPLHDDLDGEHSHPLDSPPPIPPPHMLPHLFPPPPNLPPGMPPPFPPPHFLPPPLPPPMMADRRLPPAGRLASPPFHRRMGAASPPEFLDRRSPPHFDRRSYSPASERSRYSDRQGRYSPDRHGRYSPDRHGRYSPDRQGRYSPDRQGRYSPDRPRRYSPDRHSDRLYDRHHHNDRYNNIDRHSDAYSSNGRNDSQRDSSPERPYNRSPEGFARKASPPPLHRRLYEEGGGPPPRKGQKTSTPLGPNDR